MEISIKDASVRLGLTPQRLRSLIQSGDLPARRIVDRWVVDTTDLSRLAENRSPGRPLSARMAWGLIGLLETGQAPNLSAPERSRLRGRLRDAPSLDQLARLCRSRSDVHRLRAHPGALARVLSYPGAVPTGASNARQDIVDAGRAELYLPKSQLRPMTKDLHLRDPADRAETNLLVHIPAGNQWPFPSGKAGPMTVALDLWDAGDSRSRRTASRLYRQALAAGRFEAQRS